MPFVNLSFLQDFETRAKLITVDAYQRMAANLWIWDFMVSKKTESRKEVLSWLLSTAQIEEIGEGGGAMNFDAMEQALAEFTTKHHGKGLEISRDQFEDLDGNGIEVGAEWMKQIGAYMAYYPQKLGVAALKAGHSAGSTGYDGEIFFSASHPNNPNNVAKGVYANLFTGAASGSYPGALPIDTSVSVEVAFANLQKAIAYIRGIKGPNGEDPRFLRPLKMLVAPTNMGRAVQLTNATFIAQAATGGAGGGDVDAVVKAMALVQPVVADELDGFESGTTYFLGCQDVSSTEIGGLVHIERKPFEINYYSGQGGGGATGVDAALARQQTFEWHCRGRMAAGYGHPYELHKIKAS